MRAGWHTERVDGHWCKRARTACSVQHWTSQVCAHQRQRLQKPCGGRAKDKDTLTKEDRLIVKRLMKSDGDNGWDFCGVKFEPGLPCSHKSLRMYFSEGENLKTAHKAYEAEMLKRPPDRRPKILTYDYFTRFFHFFHPRVKAFRCTEDMCDACTRHNIMIKHGDITDAEKEELVQQKAMHMDAARDQRRMVSKFYNVAISKANPDQCHIATLDVEIDTPLTDSNGVDEAELLPLSIAIQCEDYGGSLAMPHYGDKRPQSNYFNSNLNMHMYIACDLNTDTSCVYLYDERQQGKGADADCSMRTRYHLRKLATYRAAEVDPPESLIVIQENCVGQNKSQVCMQYYSFLSLTMYKKVVVIYMISGHSHMKPDRVVAWTKRQLKANVFVPEQLVERFNRVPSVEAVWLKDDDPDGPFRVGWGDVLNKHLRKMSGGFTGSFMFEFETGNCTMRHLVSTPDAEAVTIVLTNTPAATRRALLLEVFNTTNIDKLRMSNMNLAKHAGLKVSKKKIDSLAEKYHSIPEKYLHYYPRTETDPAEQQPELKVIVGIRRERPQQLHGDQADQSAT